MFFNRYAVPLSIVIAGVFIALAIFWSRSPDGNDHLANPSNLDIRQVAATDHIRGNPTATVAVVEFSDFQCPFCARLHPTLTRLIDENKNVRWVYRHFPLASHGLAFGAAVASECFARLGGNEAFWRFADAAFVNQSRLGQEFYEETARAAGLKSADFNSCLVDNRMTAAVQADLDEAIAAGGRGTPFAVVVDVAGRRRPFSGALPYNHLLALVKS